MSHLDDDVERIEGYAAVVEFVADAPTQGELPLEVRKGLALIVAEIAEISGAVATSMELAGDGIPQAEGTTERLERAARRLGAAMVKFPWSGQRTAN